jgi:bla regulator protein blaR1
MTSLWLSPEVTQALGWALVHFLWQGIALAALLSAGMGVCRSAAVRYALAVVTLALMVTAPTATFLSLLETGLGATSNPAPEASRQILPQFVTAVSPSKTSPAANDATGARLLWVVEAWFGGVFLFSLRTAGGFLALERLRRRVTIPLSEHLQQKCATLQRRLGITRAIRYCENRLLETPAVIGWFRPVVLLPVTAVTGLSEEQLEAVIAHELAHIKRFDCFVNLFQIAVETLLFYHPAVWWVNRRIRQERENCCDDVALSVCGNPVEYARALTLMDEWRVAPAWAMAANGSPLGKRIRRLLGMERFPERTRIASLTAGLFCLGAAVLAANALLGTASGSKAQSDAEKSVSVTAQQTAPQSAQPRDQTSPSAKPRGRETAKEKLNEKKSYIEGLKSAGLENLTADELVAMKIQDVTPEYVRGIHEQGLRPDPDSVIAMRVQGVTPEYVRGIRRQGLQADINQLIGMKVQGVTQEYIQEMQAAGLKPSISQVISMKVQGVSPEYVRALKDLRMHVDADNLISMRVQGVTPEYIREIEALGLNVGASQVISLRVQGVTTEYVKALQNLGLKLSADGFVSAKVQDITPEFIERARSHGFKNLDLDKLIQLKHAGVLEAEADI